MNLCEPSGEEVLRLCLSPSLPARMLSIIKLFDLQSCVLRGFNFRHINSHIIIQFRNARNCGLQNDKSKLRWGLDGVRAKIFEAKNVNNISYSYFYEKEDGKKDSRHFCQESHNLILLSDAFPHINGEIWGHIFA